MTVYTFTTTIESTYEITDPFFVHNAMYASYVLYPVGDPELVGSGYTGPLLLPLSSEVMISDGIAYIIYKGATVGRTIYIYKIEPTP